MICSFLSRHVSTLWLFDVDEVELVLPVPSPQSSNVGLSDELSIELPEGLSISDVWGWVSDITILESGIDLPKA